MTNSSTDWKKADISIIVTEMLEIVLLAAYIYPDRIGNITGGGIPQSTMRDIVMA